MTIETTRDLEGLMAVGQVVRGTIAAMKSAVCPGVTTAELARVAQQFLAHAGARSAPMIEVGYPSATCISINDEAAHGLPGSRLIAPGDLVTLDVAAELGGYYADAAITVAVPPVQAVHLRLCASQLYTANDATTCSITALHHRQSLDHALTNQYLATALAKCSAVCSRLILLGT